MEGAFEQAVAEAGYPDDPAELDRIWRQVNRHPSETAGTDNSAEEVPRVRAQEEASAS